MSCETGFAAQVPDRKTTRHRRKTYCRPNQGLLEDYQFDLGQSMKASKIFFRLFYSTRTPLEYLYSLLAVCHGRSTSTAGGTHAELSMEARLATAKSRNLADPAAVGAGGLRRSALGAPVRTRGPGK